MARLLITGGAGFIGSHTCVVLLEAGHELLVLDDFSNSSPIVLERVAELSGVLLGEKQLQLIRGDVRDAALHERLFTEAKANDNPIEAVIHFAGLKAVGESVTNPLRYWDVNFCGSRNLLSAMDAHGCRTLVFSSSATVYGNPETVPISESAPIKPINPYGHSKAAVEQLFRDIVTSSPNRWHIASLRYFNPVGAHPSGRMGEDPTGTPNNLFPYVSQVALGQREHLRLFGGDWPTPDGSGVRDFIHVMDLAEGHLAALSCLMSEPPQLLEVNLGSGQGHSVIDVVKAFEAASSRAVPYCTVERRSGDAAVTVADPTLAARRLGWRTKRSLAEMCRDGWAWQSANPNGYRSE